MSTKLIPILFAALVYAVIVGSALVYAVMVGSALACLGAWG